MTGSDRGAVPPNRGTRGNRWLRLLGLLVIAAAVVGVSIITDNRRYLWLLVLIAPWVLVFLARAVLNMGPRAKV